jgi:glutamate--cysteine ligase
MRISTKAELEKFVADNWMAINRQLDLWQSEFEQPIYSSVDIRESNHKYAPVDHNLYPAGFNNICSKDLKNASKLFRDSLGPDIIRIALLPESHTKNKWYLDNIYYLSQTLQDAGFIVDIISPDTQMFQGETQVTLQTQSEFNLTIYNVSVVDGQFQRADNTEINYDAVIINHDQSVPFEIDWKNFKTKIYPSPLAGWTRRQKIKHFESYKNVADQFCDIFNIEPDLIQAKFKSVTGMDFETKEGLSLLASEVDALLSELPAGSSVFAKASQGTYGMGISVFTSASEVLEMNRKTRNKMDVGKNNLKFTSILIQEGVETIVKVEDAPAEITMYLIGGKSMGGFMRYNPKRGTNANLNSQGMLYQKFCISDICQGTDTHMKEAIYCLIGRLSVLAASKEIFELNQ